MELAIIWLLNFWLRWANSYLAGTEGTYLVMQVHMRYPRVFAGVIQYNLDVAFTNDVALANDLT